MLRLSKYVTILGIPILLGSISLLGWMYRVVALKDLVMQGEEHNRILTKTIANAIWSQVDGLNDNLMQQRFAQADNDGSQFTLNIVSGILDKPIKELLHDTNILKLKIFNLRSRVIYSTDLTEVGKLEADDQAALEIARSGAVFSSIDLRTQFTAWDGHQVQNRQVVSSFLPVRNRNNNEIEGLIEIYSDVTTLYDTLRKSQLTFASILAAVLVSVYLTVAIMVRRLDRSLAKNIELTVARDSERRSNVAKSQFLANMSHELRTPLNAIIGYSEIIAEEAALHQTNTVVPDVCKIHGAAYHLLNLINEILDLSKIEAGQMKVFFEDISLASLTHEVIGLVKPLMAKNNNSFDYSLRTMQPLILTDGMKLRQIVLNLLSNAAKFCQNGHVGLSIHCTPHTLDVRVSDTGIGMSETQIESLYQPFVQADDSTTRKYGGTGLGLTITKQYCEMLGGQLQVSSTLGRGSEFSLRLPIQFATTGQTSPDLPSDHKNAA